MMHPALTAALAAAISLVALGAAAQLEGEEAVDLDSLEEEAVDLDLLDEQAVGGGGVFATGTQPAAEPAVAAAPLERIPTVGVAAEVVRRPALAAMGLLLVLPVAAMMLTWRRRPRRPEG